jgi:hypothetical protein
MDAPRGGPTQAWYLARDTFLGMNYRTRDHLLGLELAEKCNDDDAMWLCAVFPPEQRPNLLVVHTEKRSFNTQFAYRKILESEETPRAKCFAALLTTNTALLADAANGGYPLAQAEMWRLFGGRGVINDMKKAADAGERNGFAALGFHYHGANEHQEAYRCSKIAADMGHVKSQHHVAGYYAHAHPDHVAYRKGGRKRVL